jgi:hypothetical protein
MAIKFPDSITQNNSNYITVSAIDGDVQGIYFVDTVAERDAIGNADIALDNHRALGTVVFVGTVGYIYEGTNLTDVEWSDTANWITFGSSGGTFAALSDTDTSNLSAGDTVVFDGTNLVSKDDRLETTVTTDAQTNLDTFEVADYQSAIYSYSLKGTESRAGQVMVDYDGVSAVEITDISTNPIGTDSNPPSFTAAVSGTELILRVVNGNGYIFKAQATRI